MKIQLQAVSGPEERHSKEFDQASVKLGRGDWNDMVFNDASQRMVSRNHAEIRIERNRPILNDLQSSFGTYVNGKQITQIELHPNDVIQLGTHGPEIKILWASIPAAEQDANRTVMAGSSGGLNPSLPVSFPADSGTFSGGMAPSPGPKATVVVGSTPMTTPFVPVSTPSTPSAPVSRSEGAAHTPGPKATIVVGSTPLAAVPGPPAASLPPLAPGAKATVVYTDSEAPPAAKAGGKPQATVVMDPAAEAARAMASAAPPSPKAAIPSKQGIGKETMAVIVDEAIRKERDKVKAEAGATGSQAAQAAVGKKLALVMAGGVLLAILLVAVFLLFFRMQSQNRQLQTQLENQSQQIAELLKLNAGAQQQVEEKQKQLQADLQKILEQKDAEAKQKEAAIRAEIDGEKKKLEELQKKASALQAWNDKVKADSKSTQSENLQIATVGEGTAVLIFCRYSIGEVSNDGGGSGFLVSADGRVVTAKQVIEPWKFDPAIAYYLKASGINPSQIKQEIYIWKKDAAVSRSGQPNLSAAYSTVAGSLSVVKIAGDDMENQNYQPEDSQNRVSVRVHRVASEGNLALLQIRGSGMPVARLGSTNAAKGETVVSFGYPIGVEQPVAKPELLRAALAEGGNRPRLDKSTAPGFIGAPIFNAGSLVVGMIINQDYVVPVSAITRLVR